MRVEIPIKSAHRYRQGHPGLQSSAYRTFKAGMSVDGITRMYQVGDDPNAFLVEDYAFSTNPNVHRWLPVQDLYHGRSPADLNRGCLGVWRDRPQPMADEK